ncbi:hypothetical protein KKA85_07080 [bacterium]|nr:hypothetical protein [bacterium]MBU1675529.1 hypothetical protein [bacterium]
MEFFAGFAWALPWAFADPLEKCRFERGDVVYDDPAPYSCDWAGTRAAAGRIVQVRLPQQGDSAKQDKDAASVFADNWCRSAEVDLIETADRSRRGIPTTQGRLYTFLWRDDESVLDLEAPEPPLPLLAGELRALLDEAAPRVAAQVDAPAGRAQLFVTPFDYASSRLREKGRDIREALEAVPDCRELEFPVELDDSRDPLPTLRWKAYLVPGVDEAALTDLLKPALYNPQGDRNGRADRFNLSRHGRLIPLG